MNLSPSIIETIWEGIQQKSTPPSFLEIQEQIGEISVSNNGNIICSHHPNHAKFEEYFLWRIFCFCLDKGWIEQTITRIRLELSADSPFPYEIHTIVRQQTFKRLNLLSLRRPLPLDFWRILSNFSVQNGQAYWTYTVAVAPNIEANLNYHRLKAIGHAAKIAPQKTEQIRHLYLWDQGLTHLPSELSYLQNLERLELWNNPLQELPQTFQALPSLQEIVLSRDQQRLASNIKKYLPTVTLGWV